MQTFNFALVENQKSKPNIDHSITNFWNVAPPNGAYHRIQRPHRWSSSFLSHLERQTVARLGEKIAQVWASHSGWKILETQKRGPGFEIDLIIRKENILKIVEVKTRKFPKSDPDLNTISSWLNHRKRLSMTRGAKTLLYKLESLGFTNLDISFDLVAFDIGQKQMLTAYRWPDVFMIR